MDSATRKRVCIVAAVLPFCTLLGLLAREKEKPLLRVREVIFSWGQTRKRLLEISQNGGISLRKRKVILSTAELQALRDFLNSGAVRDLHDSYADFEITTDYSASMEIEMTPDEKTKRIVLSHLDFAGAHNSKIYPVPIHDLVCKIYGLEERVGIPYGRAVRIDLDGHKSDDTWCDRASLDLIPKPAP
jgi:hypothetical protein